MSHKNTESLHNKTVQLEIFCFSLCMLNLKAQQMKTAKFAYSIDPDEEAHLDLHRLHKSGQHSLPTAYDLPTANYFLKKKKEEKTF